MKLKTFGIKKYERVSKNNLLLWITKDLISASGSTEIASQKEMTYDCEFLSFTTGDPFVIEWKTLTDKKQSSWWRFDLNNNSAPLTKWERRKFNLKRKWGTFTTPFQNIRKFFIFKKYRSNQREDDEGQIPPV